MTTDINQKAREVLDMLAAVVAAGKSLMLEPAAGRGTLTLIVGNEFAPFGVQGGTSEQLIADLHAGLIQNAEGRPWESVRGTYRF